jgi:hypothetical protein
MKPRWTILGSCLFALAIAMVAFHHDTPPAHAPASAKPVPGAAKATPAAKTPLARTRAKTHAATTQELRGDNQPYLNGQSRSRTRETANISNPENPSRAELETRAQLVEQEANHELARLIPLLGLGPDQQQRVFQALARISPNFVAGMQVDGTALPPANGSSQQTVLAQLTDAQVAAYLQDTADASAWWSEYIDHVSSQLQEGTPSLGTSTGTAAASVPASDGTAPAETAPATKDAHPITGDE